MADLKRLYHILVKPNLDVVKGFLHFIKYGMVSECSKFYYNALPYFVTITNNWADAMSTIQNTIRYILVVISNGNFYYFTSKDDSFTLVWIPSILRHCLLPYCSFSSRLRSAFSLAAEAFLRLHQVSQFPAHVFPEYL